MAASGQKPPSAIKLLGTKRNDAYEAAMAALRDDMRQWWADTLAKDSEELEG